MELFPQTKFHFVTAHPTQPVPFEYVQHVAARLREHCRGAPQSFHLFTSTVGRKPTDALYYLPDTNAVQELLKILASGGRKEHSLAILKKIHSVPTMGRSVDGAVPTMGQLNRITSGDSSRDSSNRPSIDSSRADVRRGSGGVVGGTIMSRGQQAPR